MNALQVVRARRNTRYRVVAPVQFRAAQGEWLEGTTVNIGPRGLLVRTRPPVPPRATKLHLRIDLSASSAHAGATVACSGRLVRTHRLPSTGEVVMAVTIDRYRFEPVAERAAATVAAADGNPDSTFAQRARAVACDATAKRPPPRR